MVIVFSVCAAFVALTLVVALMGSRALNTFFGVMGGALLGVLAGSALAVGVVLLYSTIFPDRTGYGQLELIPVALLLVAIGGALGAAFGGQVGAGAVSGRDEQGDGGESSTANESEEP